jgi:hypothetical protein
MRAPGAELRGSLQQLLDPSQLRCEVTELTTTRAVALLQAPGIHGQVHHPRR